MTDDQKRDGVEAVQGQAEAAGQEQSFAELFEMSNTMTERLDPGQRVKARVIMISGDLVYVDLGGKTDGTVALSEFLDEKGVCTVKEDDEIEAFFVGVRDGLRLLTTLVRGFSSLQLNAIRDAHAAGLPVTGEVKSEVKGGFEVVISGVRGFCPFSQIDMRGGRSSEGFVGRTFPFRVLEYKDEGRTIILSRRVLLEEEQQNKIKTLRERLSEGMEIKVRIRAVQNFGAFVDLGGVDGLIPVSELSWGRVDHPKDLVTIGQEVTARILNLDWENNRFTLSLKATQPDPWSGVSGRYPVDSKVSGTIVRLAPFGAFMNLEPGIDGLIHISNLGAGRRINHPREVVAAGQVVEAHVLSVDAENKRISLSLEPRVPPKKIEYPSAGDLVSGAVEKVMPFGIFVKISEGVTGLIPNAEIGTPQGTDNNRLFTPGSQVQVVVMEVNQEQNRVSLSRKEAIRRAEMDDFARFKQSAQTDDTGTAKAGSIGEHLQAKIEEKQNG